MTERKSHFNITSNKCLKRKKLSLLICINTCVLLASYLLEFPQNRIVKCSRFRDARKTEVARKNMIRLFIAEEDSR